MSGQDLDVRHATSHPDFHCKKPGAFGGGGTWVPHQAFDLDGESQTSGVGCKAHLPCMFVCVYGGGGVGRLVQSLKCLPNSGKYP